MINKLLFSHVRRLIAPLWRDSQLNWSSWNASYIFFLHGQSDWIILILLCEDNSARRSRIHCQEYRRGYKICVINSNMAIYTCKKGLLVVPKLSWVAKGNDDDVGKFSRHHDGHEEDEEEEEQRRSSRLMCSSQSVSLSIIDRGNGAERIWTTATTTAFGNIICFEHRNRLQAVTSSTLILSLAVGKT